MSFGTTERAKILNRLPLRQRTTVHAWLSFGTDSNATWSDKAIAALGKALEAIRSTPGWDADGRPVEP
jgi:hypothetical protein